MRTGYRFYSCVLGTALFCGAVIQSAAAADTKSQTAHSLPYNWQNVKIVAGGFITGIVPHPMIPGVTFVRTDIGGAYRYDPLFKQFTPLTDIFNASDWNLMGTESIAVDPVDPLRLYLAQGTYAESWAGNGVILRSNNIGLSFDRIALPVQLGANEAGRFSGERLAVDPGHHNVLYLGTRNNGLWTSTDFGSTWGQVSTFPVTGPTSGVGVIFVAFQQTSKKPKKETIYVGVSDPTTGLYQSTDNGVTWAVVAGQPTGFRPNHYALGPDGVMYITYGDGTGEDGMGGDRIGNGAVWKYDTLGNLWTDVTPKGPWGATSLWYGFGAAAVDRQNPNNVVVSTMGRWWPGDTVYRSADAGETWLSLSSEPDTGLNYSVRDDSLSPYLNFGQGCTATSCDTSLAPFGWWIGALAIDPFDSNHALYGTGATVWETRDLTQVDATRPQMTHWAVGANGIEETSVNALLSPPAGAHLLSGVGDVSGFRHDDLTVSPPGGMSLPVITATSLDYAEKNPSLVARVGWATQAGAWATDGGSNWTAFPSQPAGASNGPGTIALSSDGTRFVWAPSSGTAAWSTDFGTTWTTAAGILPNDPVVSDRVNPLKFYGFDGNSGALYASTDGGATYAAAAVGLPSGQVRATNFAEGDLWLAAGNGLYHSSDSGAHFVNIGTVQQADAVGFGKAAPLAKYPTIFISGHVNDVIGVFRSTDAGATWVRINDDRHQWGWIGTVTGDPRVFGRVYLGTNGRGVIYGDTWFNQ